MILCNTLMPYAVRTAFAKEPGGRLWRAYNYQRQEKTSSGNDLLSPEELELWKGIVANYDAAPHLGASALALTDAEKVVPEDAAADDAHSPAPLDVPGPASAQPSAGRLRRQPGANLSPDLVALALDSRAPDPGRMTPPQEEFLLKVFAGLPHA